MVLPCTLQEEQSSVCPDATMKSEVMALVKTQVRALDFKRNQRSQLCFTASLRRMCTTVSSVCLVNAAVGRLHRTVLTDINSPSLFIAKTAVPQSPRAAEVATALAACSQRTFAPDSARSCIALPLARKAALISCPQSQLCTNKCSSSLHAWMCR